MFVPLLIAGRLAHDVLIERVDKRDGCLSVRTQARNGAGAYSA